MPTGFTDDYTGERMRGITHLLERCYWPTYNYRKATSGAVRTATGGPRGKRAGLIRGSQVDAQICGFVNRGVAPDHPYAKKILKALEVSGLTPVKVRRSDEACICVNGTLTPAPPLCTQAQIKVTDPTFGIGTGVDLVCTRKVGETKHTVICELKCGFNRPGVYDMSSGPMKKSLGDLADSPRNQHQIQTVVTRALFMATFPEVSHVDACIVRVTDEGVHLHPVDRKLYGRARAILETISLARNRIGVKKVWTKKKKAVKPVRGGVAKKTR